MAAPAITIKGAKELEIKFRNMQRGNGAFAGLTEATIHVKRKLKRYPPATAANSSGNRRWYQRGYGPRWRRADGSVGGIRSSERLDTSWTHRMSRSTMTGRAENNASYAEYVQGEQQSATHKRIGWKTGEMILRQESPTIVRFIQSGVEKDAS